jgi:hypothetical protein
MVLQPAGRAHRDEHEAAQFRVAAPAAALGDVGRDRGARTAELARQPVEPFARGRAGGLVDTPGKPMPLPKPLPSESLSLSDYRLTRASCSADELRC